MLISRKTEYGIRALIDLAQHEGEGPIPSAVIARRQSIPLNFLDQLLAPLRNAGLVRSVRGPQGGHVLVRRAEEIRLAEAVLVQEGSLAPVACLDDPQGCPGGRTCALRSVWEEVQAATLKILDGITIADLAAKDRSGQVAHYSI